MMEKRARQDPSVSESCQQGKKKPVRDIYVARDELSFWSWSNQERNDLGEIQAINTLEMFMWTNS